MSSSLSTYVRRAALGGTAAFLAAVAFAAPAAAAGSPSGVVATGGGRINIRSGPSTSAKVVATRANGSRLVLLCQVDGEKIRGHRRTTAKWNKIKGGGYVSDAYVKRGKVPPACVKASRYAASGEAPSTRQMHPHGLPGAQKSFTPSAEQMKHAKIIMETGQKMGLPARAWVIAIATSLQESTLHNHGHLGKRNDHDSLGLFQQRPSMGWGTPKQVTDPVYASTKFYNKLIRIKDWQELPLYRAAQKVQVSAFPKAYRKWEKQAGEIVQGLYGKGAYAAID